MRNIANTFIFIILVGFFNSCDEIGQLTNERSYVKDFTSGKYGYVNKDKDLVIEKKYDWARDFYSDVDFAVVELNNKRGLINKKGEVIIPLKFDKVAHLENNYFKVTDKGKTGIYNSFGKEILPTVAVDVNKLHNNKFFEVKLFNNHYENSLCLFNVKGEQLTQKFNSLIVVNGDFAIMRFNKGWTQKFNAPDPDQIEYKIFDLENKKNPINELPMYDYAHIIKQSAPVFFKLGRFNSKIVNYKGDIIIPNGKYRHIENFSEDLFSVSIASEGYGFADKNGNYVIKTLFDKPGKFENGMAKVTIMEKIFFIDKNGYCIKDCPTQKWLDFHNIPKFKVNNFLYDQLVKNGIREAKLKNYEKSIDSFNNAISENRVDYEAYHNRGLSFLMLNKYDEAEDDLDKAIMLNPTNSDSYYLRGIVSQNKGFSFDGSHITYYFEKAIELNPYNSEAYLKCAIVYGKQGNRKKSCQYIRKACELGNKDACSISSKFCK